MPDSPGVTIISRAAWGARPPKRAPHEIEVPTAELWLHHFATASWLGPSGMRSCQDYHMDSPDRGYNDIAYSFCIDPRDGTIYEGRGAGIAGGHTKNHNTISHAICFMGDTDKTEPSDAAVRSAAALAAHGQDQGWWGDWTGGHREASGAATACPGKYGMAALPVIRSLTAQYRGQSIQEDDDMPLTDEDLDRIAIRVWNRPIKDDRPGVGINASPRLVLGEMFMRSRQATTALAKLAGVSEDEIVAGILEGLSPERIAEAIPDTIAKDVADELARRLAD